MISGYVKLNQNVFIYLDSIVLCVLLHSRGCNLHFTAIVFRIEFACDK